MAKLHIVYHKDGSLWAKGKMENGVCVGYWEWFRKPARAGGDGSKLRSGHFENGKQVGEWITYDKKSKPIKTTDFK